MGLRFKVLSGFLILCFLLLAAGVWSIYELRSIGTSVQRLLDDNYKSIDAAKTMFEALERQDSGTLLLILGKWEAGRSIIKEADRSFAAAYEIARNNITIPGESVQVELIASRYAQYRAIWTKPIVGTDKEGDLTWYFNELHQAFRGTQAAVKELMAMNDRTMYATATDLKNRANRAAMPGIVAIIAAVLFSVMFSYFVNHYMVSPIVRMARGIEEYRRTGQPFTMRVDTHDEIAQLASAVSSVCIKP